MWFIDLSERDKQWIIAQLNQLKGVIMATLQDIKDKLAIQTADIEAQTTIDQSIITLLNGVVASNKEIAAELAAAIVANDPQALQDVADTLDNNTTELENNTAQITAAVTANTPAAPQ